MANDYFRFKQFTVWQSGCAMKVGTDGTLLGAWAKGGRSILDIGTGTGLVALMMAQRYPQARVVGVEIDEAACRQARQNVESSPFQVQVVCADVADVAGLRGRQVPDGDGLEAQSFDSIVSNPPYYDRSLECPDEGRTLARHTASLSYRNLMASAWRLLTDDGELSVVIAAECKALLQAEAVLAGFHLCRECAVKTTPRKPPRRYLLAFRKHPSPLHSEEQLIETSPGVRSEWYQQLTNDFYL